MHEQFQFLALIMDSLAKKMTTHHVYFSVQGVQDFFPNPLIYRGNADKSYLV